MLRYHIDIMKAVGIRVSTLALVFGIIWFVASILQVPVLQVAGLFSWGLCCMLFSYELAGSRRIYRQGFEERSWLERAWLLAGCGCMAGAVFLMVIYL